MAIIEYVKDLYPQISTVLTVFIFIPLIWRDRKTLEIKSFWQVLMFDAVMMVSGPLIIMGFYNLCRLLMPDILQSGIFGVFLFGPIVLYIFSRLLRKNYYHMSDTYARLMVVYGVLNRLNCVCHGCCGGKGILETGLTWPVRGAEILFFIILGVVFWRWRKTQDRAGLLLPIFSIAYGCFRFINEFFSIGHSLMGGLQIAHIWSVVVVGVGIATYSEFKARADRKAQRDAHRRAKKC